MDDPLQRFAAVITTIQDPTPSARQLAKAVSKVGGECIIVGDQVGPEQYPLPATEFLPYSAQCRMSYALASHLPSGHYARKNLGYLLAIDRGAECIYETDDDNAPNAAWRPRTCEVDVQQVRASSWVNAYRLFSDQMIWPRGFPLTRIREPDSAPQVQPGDAVRVPAPIQQGLADLSPDVDAVWRMVLDREFYFQPGPSVELTPGAWCPFNSQSTWWWPPAYPLMYLPSFCSFRMTDIWRSFVAQRCLWELGRGIVFHASEVVQQRNPHNLARDFEDEIEGYLKNESMIDELSDIRLQPGADAVGDNLLTCYQRLVSQGFFPEEELPLVEAWLEDIARCGTCRQEARRAA